MSTEVKTISPEGVMLEGRTVVVKGGRHFHCKDGFGCAPYLSGRKIFGHWDGNPEIPWEVISKFDVEAVVVDEADPPALQGGDAGV